MAAYPHERAGVPPVEFGCFDREISLAMAGGEKPITARAELHGPEGIMAIHRADGDMESKNVKVSVYTRKGYKSVMKGTIPLKDARAFISEVLRIEGADEMNISSAEVFFHRHAEDILKIRSKYVPRRFEFEVRLTLRSRFLTCFEAYSMEDALEAAREMARDGDFLILYGDEILEDGEIENLTISPVCEAEASEL
jgi:hypothetical protein